MNFEDIKRPEIKEVDLSQQYLDCLSNPQTPWFIFVSELRKEYRGQDVNFIIRLKWEDIPEGKRDLVANSLKAFLEKNKGECAIVITQNEQKMLEEKNDPEYMSCHNAFASGVKLEIV